MPHHLNKHRDKNVQIWEFDEDLEFSCYEVIEGHTQDVKCVRFVPQSQDLVSCSYDDTLKVWEQDDDTWHCTQTLKEH
jgi:WD40 repeat protein